jgi:hypothetical protein
MVETATVSTSGRSDVKIFEQRHCDNHVSPGHPSYFLYCKNPVLAAEMLEHIIDHDEIE